MNPVFLAAVVTFCFLSSVHCDIDNPYCLKPDGDSDACFSYPSWRRDQLDKKAITLLAGDGKAGRGDGSPFGKFIDDYNMDEFIDVWGLFMDPALRENMAPSVGKAQSCYVWMYPFIDGKQDTEDTDMYSVLPPEAAYFIFVPTKGEERCYFFTELPSEKVSGDLVDSSLVAGPKKCKPCPREHHHHHHDDRDGFARADHDGRAEK